MNKQVEQIRKEIERLAEVGRNNASCFDEYRKEKAVWLQQADVCDRILSFIDSLDDKCDGCNNIRGCITCKDGSEWAHYEEPVSKAMRKININNPEELKKFKLETSGFVSSYGFPYKLDDLTEKGANYTVFCPLKWKSVFSPAKLRKLLKEDVDADKITIEYIDFVKEDVEEKSDKVYNVDYW